MSSRYSLRQTPKKKELFEGMIETPATVRRSTHRRQTSSQLEGSDPEKDERDEKDTASSSAPETSPIDTMPPRRRTAKFTEGLDEDEDDLDVKPLLNGNDKNKNKDADETHHESANGSSKKSNGSINHHHGLIDGWRPGQDAKIDTSGEFEFGGSWGSGSMMILFPILMWYMWVGATYYDGKFPHREPGQSWPAFASHLAGLVYEGAFPHARAWLWYWSYLVVEGVFYCTLPGVWSHGKPLPHEGGKQLRYFCNAYVSLYTTLAVLAALHFSGAWPLQNAIDHFGPLLSVAILSGILVSVAAYASALWRGAQHRMTGYPVYDFFMGAELNPRLFGLLDFKMFFEVRMPWYILLILSLGAAARQHEQYGYVSAEVGFLVMAHFLYANACAKGEELIVVTWDMFYEKWGFMLIFWNLAGVPLSYCHCTIYLANHDPATYRWNRYALVAFYAAYLFWYWVWDSCNSQKNRFRAAEKGQVVWRNTFPQVPWQTVRDPKTIQTPQGTILVDGWYGLARKIHYTADVWFAISWALITGFESPFPWFYPVFFVCMISHRAARDIHRCRQKYGEAWLEYERRVPYLFVPYLF